MNTVKIKDSIWVIGDVHGEYKQLKTLIKKIPKKAKICFVGDLIDKGENSKKIVKLVRDNNYYVVKGNHEEMAINNFKIWIQNGGKEAILSYTDKKMKDLNPLKEYKKNKILIKDIKWFSKLPLIIKFSFKNKNKKIKPLYVSHSGLKMNKEDKKIKKNNPIKFILWNRKKQKEVGYAMNIHGHTPVGKKYSRVSKSQINIDSGNYLTAIEYPSLKRVYSDD